MTTKRLDVIENAADFGDLADAWNELLQDSAADCVFLTWEWLYTWWTHLSGGRRLAIVTVRSGTILVAVAPFMLGRRRLAGLGSFPRLEFLGAGDVGSDYLDVIVRSGHEREA